MSDVKRKRQDKLRDALILPYGFGDSAMRYQRIEPWKRKEPTHD
jgi:hypothetical protein